MPFWRFSYYIIQNLPMYNAKSENFPHFNNFYVRPKTSLSPSKILKHSHCVILKKKLLQNISIQAFSKHFISHLCVCDIFIYGLHGLC